MVIELLSPMALAIEPTKVDLDSASTNYSHETQQTAVGGKSATSTLAYGGYQMPTYGGTQTFDFRGQPWDSDND